MRAILFYFRLFDSVLLISPIDFRPIGNSVHIIEIWGKQEYQLHAHLNACRVFHRLWTRFYAFLSFYSKNGFIRGLNPKNSLRSRPTSMLLNDSVKRQSRRYRGVYLT